MKFRGGYQVISKCYHWISKVLESSRNGRRSKSARKGRNNHSNYRHLSVNPGICRCHSPVRAVVDGAFRHPFADFGKRFCGWMDGFEYICRIFYVPGKTSANRSGPITGRGLEDTTVLGGANPIPHPSKIHGRSARGVGNEKRAPADRGSIRPPRFVQRPIMPSIILPKERRYAVSFPYIKGGRARIVVHASISVVVIVADALAGNIGSIKDAQEKGAYVFSGKSDYDETISLGLKFILAKGWKLIIGNPSHEDAAVYFEVTEAPPPSRGGLFGTSTSTSI
jgi:hypothetical protein